MRLDIELFIKKVDLHLSGKLKREAMTIVIEKFEEQGINEKTIRRNYTALMMRYIQYCFGNIP